MANIPGIPSLPTDNLYKFIALSGVVIAIVSATGYLIFNWNFEKDKLLAKAAYKINNVETDQLQALGLPTNWEEFKDYAGTINSGQGMTIDSDLPSNDAFKVAGYLKDTWKSLTETEIMVSNLEYQKKRRFEYNLSIIVFFVIGVSMSIFGFFTWYFKAQKLQDMLLISTLEEAKLKVEKLRKEVGNG